AYQASRHHGRRSRASCAFGQCGRCFSANAGSQDADVRIGTRIARRLGIRAGTFEEKRQRGEIRAGPSDHNRRQHTITTSAEASVAPAQIAPIWFASQAFHEQKPRHFHAGALTRSWTKEGSGISWSCKP